MNAIAFPAAPTKVPPDLTRPSTAYRYRILAILAGLIGFLLFYLLLIGTVIYAIIWLAENPPTLPKDRGVIIVIVAYLGGFVALGMLLVLLVKGLFKSQQGDRQRYVRVTREEQPVLFEFIDKVCDETSAPRPHGVYISPDVNAAVMYDTSLVNLVVPPKKYLVIGAGLVNAIGLREFKATLAHEFGHFSQKKRLRSNSMCMSQTVCYTTWFTDATNGTSCSTPGVRWTCDSRSRLGDCELSCGSCGNS
jgi:Zn-dependent protease with chaperone function